MAEEEQQQKSEEQVTKRDLSEDDGAGDAQKVKKMKATEPADLSDKITKQIEYYFSDVNAIKDKFLRGEFAKDDGWVKLSTLLTFVRLKQLTTDEDRIVKAMRDFDSEVVEFDATKKAVRRKKPIPDADEFKKQLDLRTIHISGFPVTYNFDELHQFCGQHGAVESISMRRHFKTKFFKGCIHAVYKNESDVKKILDENALKIKDRELRLESMEAYYKRKEDMAKNKAEKRKKGKPR